MGGRWMALLTLVWSANAMPPKGDTNTVFSPCTDTTIQRHDGFTLGLAFSSKDKFFFNQTQLSPCDTRLQLSVAGAQLALFRPKVDEISLLTLDNNSFDPVSFAGKKYAARSPPAFVADATRVVINFTLVLEFEKGILYNLYWKKFGCKGCPVADCVDQQDCAVETSKCKSDRGCNLGIQVLFSGTDKHHQVLNSWYEATNHGKYSQFGLYAGLLMSRLKSIFG